jgi:hypothetical protein
MSSAGGPIPLLRRCSGGYLSLIKRNSASEQAQRDQRGDNGPVIRYFTAWLRLRERGVRRYSPLRCLWMNAFRKPTCGYGCRWVAPYGFVPDMGCPEHDAPPDPWHGAP